MFEPWVSPEDSDFIYFGCRQPVWQTFSTRVYPHIAKRIFEHVDIEKILSVGIFDTNYTVKMQLIFEGVCVTAVILAPGACGMGGPSRGS